MCEYFCHGAVNFIFPSLTVKGYIGNEEKADRWKEYLRKLYAGQELGDVLEKESRVDMDNLGYSIMKKEFEVVFKNFKNNKAPDISCRQKF